MSPQNGGGSLAEVGWRDYTTSSGSHYFKLFSESCFGGSGCSVTERDSGCATAGTLVTVYIKEVPTGSGYWPTYYACNGGGYTQITNDAETFTNASPRVETFRAGPAGGGGFILDYHDSLQHWDQYGNLYRQFGLMTCALGMSNTYGVPNGNPATAWQTASTGSC